MGGKGLIENFRGRFDVKYGRIKVFFIFIFDLIIFNLVFFFDILKLFGFGFICFLAFVILEKDRFFLCVYRVKFKELF